MLSSSDQNKAS